MSQRRLKVNAELRVQIARIIERELEFPDVLVTIAEVDCAPDLKSAKVWTSILPATQAGSTIERLRKTAGLVRSKLAKEIRLRHIPKLNFLFDDTQKHAAELEDVLASLD